MKPWAKASPITGQKTVLLLRLLKPSSSVSFRAFSTEKDNDQKKVIVRPGGRQSTSGLVATVFGCTGLTGRYIVNLLARMGTQVVCPYRGDGMKVRDLKLMGDLGQIVPLPFDLFDKESVHRAVARSNVVINLIGTHQGTRNWSFHDTNAKAAFRLAQICKESGVQRFIQLSALGAHPEHRSEFLKTKAEGETLVRSIYPDATILRPAIIFGPNDRFIQRWIKLFYRKGRLIPITNHGQGKIQPVFVEDVARAILHSITTDGHEGKTYHLGGPEVRAWAEWLTLMQEHQCVDGIFSKAINYPHNIAMVIGKLYETFFIFPNQRGLYNRDTLTQMMYDIVVPSAHDTLTLSDLHVHDTTAVFPYLTKIMIEQYRDNALVKLESFDGRDVYFD